MEIGVTLQRIATKILDPIPVLIVVISAICGYLFWSSSLGEYLDQRIARYYDFNMRRTLGMDPQIHPSLKIYSYDDHSLEIVGRERFTFDQWSQVLQAMDRSKPRGILIDKIFSAVVGRSKSFRSSTRRIGKMASTVYTGAFISQGGGRFGGRKLGRKPLSLNSSPYNLSALTGDEFPPLERLGTFPRAYGAHQDLRSVFSHPGHLSHGGGGRISAGFLVEGSKVLPHAALLIGGNLEVSQGKFWVGGKSVPVDREGRILVNFVHPNVLYSHHRVLGKVLKDSRNKGPLKGVNPGDTILVLPEMFTGHTDNTSTPFGLHPGGIVMTSMANSVLSGRWLKEYGSLGWTVVLSSLLGGILGSLLGVFTFTGVSIAIVLAVLGGATWAFCAADFVTPWLPSLASYIASGSLVFFLKARSAEEQSRVLRSSLEGLLPEQMLEAILRDSDSINMEFNEQEISIMFIDIVGFSIVAETMEPKMVFHELKLLLGYLGDRVKAHGGIVDKSLGDGLLCYFGYRFGHEAPPKDHALRALRCAMEMQEESVSSVIKAGQQGKPVFPLRIGINTAPAFVGNVGSDQRIDLTAIGSGVNYGKRLEAGCEVFKVLVSERTHRMIPQGNYDPKCISNRRIHVKHYDELQRAYEYDPLYLQPRVRHRAFSVTREHFPTDRALPRWKVADSPIYLACDGELSTIRDFSARGLSLTMQTLLEPETEIDIGFEYLARSFREELESLGVSRLRGEVRWSSNRDHECYHGIMFKDCDEKVGLAVEQVLFDIAYPNSRSQRDRPITDFVSHHSQIPTSF